MAISEIRWVGIGKEWEQAGYGNPYIGGRPTATDLLELVNTLLAEQEEIDCSVSDVRMGNIPNVLAFIELLNAKGIV